MAYPFDSSPAVQVVAVTKSDSANFAECRALYIGTGGDVVIVASNGGVATFKNAASGQIIPVRAVRVNVTGSTATDIVALY